LHALRIKASKALCAKDNPMKIRPEENELPVFDVLRTIDSLAADIKVLFAGSKSQITPDIIQTEERIAITLGRLEEALEPIQARIYAELHPEELDYEK
jgi:hypothetical protein